MWIEKIVLFGFGGITNEQIEFGSDQLNLIVEPNEYGKSTLAEGILATLFGFPEQGGKSVQQEKETLKPWDSRAPYMAQLDLVSQDRPLRILRNFQKNEVQVIDRSDFSDVTSQFLGSNKEDLVGTTVTGMSRDLFRSTCLLGQRHLDSHHATSTNDIAPTFQGMADTSSPATTASGAIDALNEALSNYTYAGMGNRKTSVENAVKELENAKSEMHQRLLHMEQERRSVVDWLNEIVDIDKKLSVSAKLDPVVAAEYDSYRMDLKGIDRRLEVAKQRFEEKSGLEDKLKEIDMNIPVAAPVLATLNDLWTRRGSRQVDANRLADEIEPQQEELQALQNDIAERYKSLDNLTPDEANSISALSINLYKLQQDLSAMQRDHQEQTGRHLEKLMVSTKQHGAALETLKSLDKAEIEEAKNYSSLLVMFYDQVQEEQKKTQECRFSIDDIEERRKSKRNQNLGKAIGSFAAAGGMIASLVYMQDIKDAPQVVTLLLIGILILGVIGGIVFVGMVINFKYYLRDDAASANEEEQKHKKVLTQLKGKITNLEAKLTTMAMKTGAGTKDDLIRYINESSIHDTVVQEQESRDSSLGNEEARMNKIKKDLAYYFEKAGLDATNIDSKTAMDLSQQISNCNKEKADLEQRIQDVQNAQKQLEFLISEIVDIERDIEGLLARAGVTSEAGIDALEGQIEELLTVNASRQTVLNEIARAEFELADFPNAREAIRDMEIEREVVTDKIRNMVDDNPDLEFLPEPDSQVPTQTVLPWGDSADGDKAALKARKEELVLQLRTSLNYRDEHYLETVEELAIIDHELICARRAKLALSMARDVIRAISSENYIDWSEKLNQESMSLVSQLNMDIESLTFDHSLNIALKLRGYDKDFSSTEIQSRLSTGTREQVYWLARIVMSRFLSQKQALPIVLDEPFSEADDSRFLSMMKFLIGAIAPHNQLIILSCHHQRHQWLSGQLNADEREKLSFITRTKLESGGVQPEAVR